MESEERADPTISFPGSGPARPELDPDPHARLTDSSPANKQPWALQLACEIIQESPSLLLSRYL